MWGLIAGLPILFKFNVVGREPRLLRNTLVGVVGATASVEFFINACVFPLWAELLLQPFLAVVAMTSIVAGSDEKTMRAKQLIDGVSVATRLQVPWTQSQLPRDAVVRTLARVIWDVSPRGCRWVNSWHL